MGIVVNEDMNKEIIDIMKGGILFTMMIVRV